jgi:hypothetical protein
MTCVVFEGFGDWAHIIGDDGLEVGGIVGLVVADSEVLNRVSIVCLILGTCGELYQLE